MHGAEVRRDHNLLGNMRPWGLENLLSLRLYIPIQKKHGLSAEQVPVSAYGGSSKNLKKIHHPRLHPYTTIRNCGVLLGLQSEGIRTLGSDALNSLIPLWDFYWPTWGPGVRARLYLLWSTHMPHLRITL